MAKTITVQQRQKFLALVSGGKSQTEAAAASGFSRKTGQRTLNDPKFAALRAKVAAEITSPAVASAVKVVSSLELTRSSLLEGAREAIAVLRESLHSPERAEAVVAAKALLSAARKELDRDGEVDDRAHWPDISPKALAVLVEVYGPGGGRWIGASTASRNGNSC